MRHDASMTDRFDFGRFDALTFDCYGTLIDWETGLSTAMRKFLDPRGVSPDRRRPPGDLRPLRSRGRAAALSHVSRGPGVRRPGRRRHFGVEPTEDEIGTFSGSVVDWPAFDDSPAALALLKTRFKLGVLTNCDDDLFAVSNRRLGVEFDWVVTAQQARGYKPAVANFELLFERLGLPRDRILHVAQSLFHDHVPAQGLGLSSIWIHRRHDRSGGGATLPADATPDLTFPDMASFAAAATAT